MRYAGLDFVIAARAAVDLDRTAAGDGSNHKDFVAVGPRLGPAEHVTEPTAGGRTRPTIGARLPTRHANQPKASPESASEALGTRRGFGG